MAKEVKKESDTRTEKMLIRFNKEEKDRTKQRADEAGCSMSEYVRRRVLDDEKKINTDPEILKLLGEISERATEIGDKKLGRKMTELWKLL